MTYVEHLIQRATLHWIKEEDIPLDLFCEMQSEGLIVSEIKQRVEIEYGIE
jgi:hypothetical protein